jgi:hypothetical protein
VGRIMKLGAQPVNLTAQFYGNTVHPPGGSPWGMRMQIAFLFRVDSLESCPGANLDSSVVQFVDCIPFTGSRTLEDTAPELFSSPHTKALAASVLKMGISSCARERSVSAKTASVTARVCRIVTLWARCQAPMPTCRWADDNRAGPYALSYSRTI